MLNLELQFFFFEKMFVVFFVVLACFFFFLRGDLRRVIFCASNIGCVKII